MNFKRVTLAILTIAFAVISYFLIKAILLNDSLSQNSLLVLFFSFGIYGSITTAFAYMNSTFKIYKMMGNYYSVSNTQLWLRLSQIFGIQIFRNIILLFYWGKRGNRKKYFSGGKSGVHQLIRNSQKAEFGHIGSFVVLILASLILGYKEHIQYALTILILNVFGNVYPILLQRYNRIRAQKILHT